MKVEVCIITLYVDFRLHKWGGGIVSILPISFTFWFLNLLCFYSYMLSVVVQFYVTVETSDSSSCERQYFLVVSHFSDSATWSVNYIRKNEASSLSIIPLRLVATFIIFCDILTEKQIKFYLWRNFLKISSLLFKLRKTLDFGFELDILSCWLN